MKNYVCTDCDKVFKKKSNYIRHINRAFTCTGIRRKPEIQHNCTYCKKIYTTSGNLTRHYTTCKQKAIYDESIKQRNEQFELFFDKMAELEKQNKEIKDTLSKENYELKKEVELLKLAKIGNPQLPGVTNTNNKNSYNNNNNNNKVYYDQRVLNISINPFGKEDVSYLKNTRVNALLGRPKVAVEEMVKEIHCNEEHPENNNAYVSNKRDNTGVVFNGTIWEHRNKEEIIEDVVDNSFRILEDRYDEILEQQNHNLEKLSASIRRFETLRDWWDNPTCPNMEKIRGNTNLILYNNKTRAEELRKIKGM
jgi:hypothetical protein